MNYDRLFERECPNCISCKPGRKSDCEIRKALYYGLPTTPTMKQWCEGQVFSGACKQRKVK